MQTFLLTKIFFFTFMVTFSLGVQAAEVLKNCDTKFELLEKPKACICVSKKIELVSFGEGDKDLSFVGKIACEKLGKEGFSSGPLSVTFSNTRYNFSVSDYNYQKEYEKKSPAFIPKTNNQINFLHENKGKPDLNPSPVAWTLNSKTKDILNTDNSDSNPADPKGGCEIVGHCSEQIDKYAEMKYQAKSAQEVLDSSHFHEDTKKAVRAHIGVKDYIQEKQYSTESYNKLVDQLSGNGVSVKDGRLPEGSTDKDVENRISSLGSLESNLQAAANSKVKKDLDEQGKVTKESIVKVEGTGNTEGVKALEEQAVQKGVSDAIAHSDNFSDQADRGYLVRDKRYNAEIRSNLMQSDRGQGCSAQINEFHLMHQDTATALDSSYTAAYAASQRFEIETCRRYTQDNYFQMGIGQSRSIGSGDQFKIKNICADSAKMYGNRIGNLTGCQEIAKQLMSCVAPSNQIISCPKLYLKNQLAPFEQQPANVFESKKKELIDKIVKEHEALSVTKDALAAYLNKYQRGQIVDECTTECQTYYRSEASMAGIPNGFQGCLASVTAEDVSNTIHHCVAYKEVAKIHFKGNQFESRDGQDNRYESFDGKFRCARSTPFAADYRACKSLVNTYNAAFVGEQALGMSEGVQRSIREANSYERLAEAQAGGGDIQTLGINVVKDSAKTNEVLATQRAGFYTAQVAVLTPMLLNYPSKGNIKRNCRNSESELDAQLCVNAIDYAEISGSTDQMFFPNKGTRNQFWAELIQAAGKSAVAWIQRGQYRKQQNILGEVQKQMAPEVADGGFDLDPTYCQRYPNSNECRGSGIRQNVDGFNNGGINVGSVGNNDYAFGNDGVGEYNEGRDLPSASTINDITSMLGEGGEKGSNDFNKVAAAELTRGAAGGGGGGGPAGGGGAASLSGGSGGAAGGEGEGTGDVGITKSNGKYAGTGGTAYTAGTARRLGQDQKVDNPFSSLFGAKNSARDVASQVDDDIAPAKIGLFETISNRYTKVNNDKRLLDSNVK